MNVKNSVFVLLLGSLISSCGFHLRGNQDLSSVLPEVQIQGISIHSDLGRELKRSLSNAKVTVVDESDVLLSITNDSFSKRVLSLDNAGRANQYELSYLLSFSLIKKVTSEESEKQEKQPVIDLIPAQNITVKREYLFDANLVLEKSDEETRLNNDMRQAAMLQLLRRIRFSLKSKNKLAK